MSSVGMHRSGADRVRSRSQCMFFDDNATRLDIKPHSLITTVSST